ncbi:FAD:protein FMN transferase [Methylophilaceae bacterium]|jgi:thiamine biosynthesis lipoprotein|nr:FAD:protein FMN transferase [Methylophilaceae bacterium]|tara:strand:- start:4375 stop:5418 length:1044 start_codon:yes stop_codon:yes gene_type:complete
MRLNSLLLYFLISFLFGCSDNKIHNSKDFIFGTLIDIKIYGESKINAEKVSNDIFNEFHRLHKLLHPWDKSLITDINNAISEKKFISINNDEVITILRDAQRLENQTQNLFNPSIGKLIKLWGFHSNNYDQETIPNKETIQQLVSSNPSMQSIKIENGVLKSNNKNVQIDLGGYAKGYALDQAKKILIQNNVENALINIGGNILAFGKHGERNWVVGIQNPRKPNALATINLKPGWAIGTSGDYQRYIMVNNQRYSHLINPQTGYPGSKTQSATVLIAPSEYSGVLSDVFSKPLFITSKENKANIAKLLNIKNFLIVMDDKSILISESLNKKIHWEEDIDKKIITIL